MAWHQGSFACTEKEIFEPAGRLPGPRLPRKPVAVQSLRACLYLGRRGPFVSLGGRDRPEQRSETGKWPREIAPPGVSCVVERRCAPGGFAAPRSWIAPCEYGEPAGVAPSPGTRWQV